MPPKPVGDGPDYENIAYHLSQGQGWSFDWTDPGWRAAYMNAEPQLPAIAVAADNRGATVTSYAAQLSRRDGLAPTTARPPLLPALVAMLYWVLDRGPSAFAAVRIMLAICLAVGGALAVAMSARIATALTRAAWPVPIAAATTLALASLDRTVRSYTTDFLTEPVALLLVQLWIWCICELLGVFDRAPNDTASMKSSSRRTNALAALSGILLGLLIYARSTFVLWLPGIWLLVALAWYFRRSAQTTSQSQLSDSRARRVRGFIVSTQMIATCLLVCAPWWIRNCVVLQAPLPLGTQGATTLVGGYSDESLERRGEWQIEPEIRLRQRIESELAIGEGGSQERREVRVARAASKQVQSWIAQHMEDLPRLFWYRLVSEWSPYSGRALIWKMAALLGLGVLALLLPRAAFLIVGVLLINSLMVMLLYSVGGRFLVPTYGILYTLAGIGLASPAIALTLRKDASHNQTLEPSDTDT